MAGYGFVTTSGAGNSNQAANSWRNESDPWQSGQARGQMDAMSSGMAAAQADRTAFDAGRSAAGGSAFSRQSNGGNSAFSQRGGGGGSEGGGILSDYLASGQASLPQYRGQGGPGASPPVYGDPGNSGGMTWFNPDGSPKTGLPGGLGELSQQSLDYWGPRGNVDKAGAYVQNIRQIYDMMNQDREWTTNEDRWAFDARQGQWRDVQELNLNRDRLGLDEWTAQKGAEQWDKQFGFQNRQWDDSFGLQNRQFEADNFNTQFANQAQRDYWMGQVDNEAVANENQRNYWTGQLDNQRTGLANEQWMNEQTIANQQTAMRIDEMWRRGQLTNEQRSLALQELTQSQNNQFRYDQMGQEESQFGRTLDSTERYRQLQAQLQREEMQNAARLQAYASFGRSQLPNARFMRG